MKRREFLAAGAMMGLGIGLDGAGIGLAQGRRGIQRRQAKTARMFKAPGMYPNALAVAPEGLWIGQQKLSVEQATEWHEPVPTDRNEAAWLVDWSGKLLKTVITESRNTSGMAYGDRLCLDDGKYSPAGRLSDGHELQAGSPPADSACPLE